MFGIARTEADLEETQRQCGERFTPVVGDVSRAEDVERLFALAEADGGGVDVLVNNAAVYPKVAFLDQNPDDFERALCINVMGVARTCHRALPGMLERGVGRVVNVGSYAFLAPIPKAALYSASKGAVSSLTKAIACEIDRERFPNVLVNELMPGVFRTRMTPNDGEDPAVAFNYLAPLLQLPAGGPHGQIFLKGQLQEQGGGGVASKLKKGLGKLFGA